MATEQFGVAEINGEIRRIMDVIAGRMGLDSLPMRNPGINWFKTAEAELRGMGFSGQKLEHATFQILGTIALQSQFDPNRPDQPIKEGSLFSYPGYFERKKAKGEKPAPFDSFFLRNVHQKGGQLRKKEVRQQIQHGPSITAPEEYGGISETTLPHGESAFEAAAASEESAKQERLLSEIPAFLASKGHGDVLVLIWDLMTSKYTGGQKWTLKDVAEELNSRGLKTARGGEWTPGSVHSVWEIAQDLVKRYLKRSGVDFKSIESSRINVKRGRRQ